VVNVMMMADPQYFGFVDQLRGTLSAYECDFFLWRPMDVHEVRAFRRG